MPNTSISILIKRSWFKPVANAIALFTAEAWVIAVTTALAIVSTYYSFIHGYIISYGDSESHLNIAKRVVDSLTPGFAQLGGIWLPLPHLLLVPFVYFDPLWHTGLAGSIVSGIAFVISALYIYKLVHLLTHRKAPSLIAVAVFVLNPNMLYMQTTPMTELPLIVFFVLSSYFFIRFLLDDTKLLMLIAAAGFGFCASLSRYDGWALVMMEAGVLFLYYLPWRVRWEAVMRGGQLLVARTSQSLRERWSVLEGRLILFSTLAFFGIFLWLLWSYLILGDPLYFTHSQFSANSQQKGWLAKGELPAYHHPWISFLYYFVTTISIGGILPSLIAIVGLFYYSFNREERYRLYIMLVLLVPFFFNWLALFIGQSVIFIPSLTPTTFEWTLFNVRYGLMMIPAIAVLAGYAYARSGSFGKTLVVGFIAAQCLLYVVGYSPVLVWQDGVLGLSSETAKMPDAQRWFDQHYDYGLVLMDDYNRTMSIVRSPVPMQNVIYIGNKPYWDQSMTEPERYARWIIIQKGDYLWTHIYEDPVMNGRLYKYFQKEYTSDTILIFRRIDSPASTR